MKRLTNFIDNKILLFIVSLVLFQGCVNKKERFYNERVARMYYDVSEYFEDLHKNLQEGTFITRYDMIQDGKEFEINDTGRAIGKLETIVEGSVSNLNSLQPSLEAKEFHEKIELFFTKVKDEYLVNANLYSGLRCDCPAKKDSITVLLNKIYDDISNVETEALEKQKEYHKRIGL